MREIGHPPPANPLAGAKSLLAVCAHPDDESFGLGAALSCAAGRGTSLSVLCFTRGEASTLGTGGEPLERLRATEFTAAARVLGVARCELGNHPDGSLSEVPLPLLAGQVQRFASAVPPDLVLVFDENGVTGHPDHRQATRSALEAHLGVPILAWSLPLEVTEALNGEFGTSFAGRPDSELDLTVVVDRSVQLRAISCHASQARDNPVLWRRLELQGDREWFRWLRPPIS